MRVTCLIVGLLPLIIILTIASTVAEEVLII